MSGDKDRLITIAMVGFFITSIIGYFIYVNWPQPKCSNPQIKGNISIKTEEKIYHNPGDLQYDNTVINEDYGEKWFCTEQDAEDAGWRHVETR
jgi:hypothetical protein